MVSLPIPDTDHVGTTLYRDLRFDASRSYLDLLTSLGFKRFNETSPVHLDPDLVYAVRDRRPGWRGLLGQSGPAAGHLRNKGIGAGDLFLFFGRFRHSTQSERGYSFRKGWDGRDFHALWGYLEIAEVIPNADRKKPPAWAKDHPHFAAPFRTAKQPNDVYVAVERLPSASDSDLPGWGVFRWNEALRLTDPESRLMSHWRLPGCLHPENAEISYLGSNFGPPGEWVSVTAPGRGQELVCKPLNDQAEREIREWALRLVEDCVAFDLADQAVAK